MIKISAGYFRSFQIFLDHKADDEDTFTITIERERLNEIRTKFPFWKDADHFNISG